MTREDKINFVRRYCPECNEEECLDKYETYQSYLEEGQTSIVSRQYAGMLTSTDIGEY